MLPPSSSYLLLRTMHLKGAQSASMFLKLSLLDRVKRLSFLSVLCSVALFVQFVLLWSNQWMVPAGYPPTASQYRSAGPSFTICFGTEVTTGSLYLALKKKRKKVLIKRSRSHMLRKYNQSQKVTEIMVQFWLCSSETMWTRGHFSLTCDIDFEDYVITVQVGPDVILIFTFIWDFGVMKQ